MLTRFRNTRLYDRVSRHEWIHQFVKYALIGGLNVAIHLAIYNLLTLGGLSPLAANAIAFFFASVNSFIWNKLWAFRDQRREAVVRQYLLFVGFTLIGLGLHTAAFSVWLLLLGRHGRLGENAALLLALPVSVVWNFTSYRLWTFKPSVRRASV